MPRFTSRATSTILGRLAVSLAVSLTLFLAVSPALMRGSSAEAQVADVWDRVEHRYADNDGVSIHYVTLGEGPLVVMIHGFPDFWYLWRDYIAALSSDYQVVAIDQRGYNQSGKPTGVDNYDFEFPSARNAFRFKYPVDEEHYMDGLRQAGLAED